MINRTATNSIQVADCLNVNPEQQANPIENLENRYQTLNVQDKESLQKDTEFGEFLPRAIDFLDQCNVEDANQLVAYLTDYSNQLPKDLTCKNGIQQTTKQTLRGLLDQRNFLSSDAEKQSFILKLETLYNKLYEDKLTEWENAFVGRNNSESAERIISANWLRDALKLCKEDRSAVVLKLSREVCEIPPFHKDLAKEITHLRLSNLKQGSLKGLPAEMPNLKYLLIKENKNLKSLEGMPKELPNLKGLRIEDLKKLKSFEGLPKYLPQLKELRVEKVPNAGGLQLADFNPPPSSMAPEVNKRLNTFVIMPPDHRDEDQDQPKNSFYELQSNKRLNTITIMPPDHRDENQDKLNEVFNPLFYKMIQNGTQQSKISELTQQAIKANDFIEPMMESMYPMIFKAYDILQNDSDADDNIGLKQDLIEKMALHAYGNPDMTDDGRKLYQIDELASKNAWREHIERDGTMIPEDKDELEKFIRTRTENLLASQVQ